MANTLNNIKTLEKKIRQVEARISATRFLDRKKDTQIKRSLGRVFLLSGIKQIVDTAKFTPREIIIIGGLAKVSQLDFFKLSQTLGALNITVNQCDDMLFADECKKIGEDYYQDENKLTYPFSLFLGIMIKAKAYLHDEDNIKNAHQIGDDLFEQNRQRKVQRRLQQIKQQYQ